MSGEIKKTAVDEDLHSLKHASSDLKSDKEFVLAAVTKDGGALIYASDELKEDRDVLLAAGKTWCSARERYGW